MNIYNVPDDKRDREIHLKARKWALLELEQSLEEFDIPVSVAILGQVHNDIEDINKILEA